MKPWNNESLNNLLSKYSDFEGVLHGSEESGNIKKKIKVQPEGQGAAPGMIVYGAKQKVLNILAEISGIVSTGSEYKKPYEGVGDIDKTEASVKKFDESEHQLGIETKSLVAELSQKELSEKFIKLRTDLGMWMIEANNPLEEKKIVGILQDIKGIDSWPVFKEGFFIAAISAKSPEIYFQMKNIYKVIVNLTKKGYHISCMDQIFGNSGKFFENQAYVDSLLKNLKLLENYHPSPSIRKIIMEEIFGKTNPSQLASLDGEKLLVLFQVIDTMSSKEIFLDFIHWNYEKINIILKSNYSIYTIIGSLDEQLVIFGNRPVRSYIYVDYFISELQNLKTFHGSLKENPFLKALREPTSDIPLLVREYSKNFGLDTSKFDIEALKDALMEDSEMTLLNIGFFCRKTNLKRSQFPDWQSFMLAEVRERSKETKTIIMKEIRKSSILSEKEIEEAVRKIKETQTVTVNLKKDGIEGFLKTGELKSTWEFNGMNGIGSGKLYMQNRDQVESIYGVATRLDEKFMEHPISGALVTEKSLQDKDMLGGAGNRNYEHYGRNYIKLRKESIVGRTVFTTGNTMAPYNFQEIVTNKGLEKKGELLSHAQIDHETAAYAKYLQLEHKLEFGKNGSNDYIEALILGSVKIGDIEGIYISTESICTELRAKFPQYSHLILHMPN